MTVDGQTQAIRVLLADEDEKFRDEMRARLASEQNLELVGIAADGERASRLVVQLRPDVAILSVNLPRLDGISVAETISVEVPFCQVIVLSDQDDLNFARRAMIAGAREFLVKPIDASDVVSAIYRLQQAEEKRRTAQPSGGDRKGSSLDVPRRRTGRVIVVWGPKGGVGRTFLAVNLAVAIAEIGGAKQRTLIIDGSLHFGSVDIALDVQSRSSLYDLLVDSNEELDPDLVHRVVVRHSSGVDVLLAPPAENLLLVSATQVQRILAVTRFLYSNIVIDTHPALDETTLAFLDLADTIVAVSTPELAALRNLRAFLAAAKRLGYSPDKITVVINRSDMRNAVSASEIERMCGKDAVVTLPNDHDFAAGSIDEGKPLVSNHPQRPLSKQIKRLAAMMVGQDSAQEATADGRKGRVVTRLFGRRKE